MAKKSNGMGMDGTMSYDVMPHTNQGSEMGFAGRDKVGVCNKNMTGSAGKMVGLDVGFKGPIVKMGGMKR